MNQFLRHVYFDCNWWKFFSILTTNIHKMFLNIGMMSKYQNTRTWNFDGNIKDNEWNWFTILNYNCMHFKVLFQSLSFDSGFCLLCLLEVNSFTWKSLLLLLWVLSLSFSLNLDFRLWCRFAVNCYSWNYLLCLAF